MYFISSLSLAAEVWGYNPREFAETACDSTLRRLQVVGKITVQIQINR